MSVLIDKALALVLPEVKASAQPCAWQYRCSLTGYYRRKCCHMCSSWERIGAACPV
ncbi:hypothetical protein [Nonomuraea mesophila]|uniref:hypothetical protein n=1 Tax=Nonomuraea mesophila TaxID=2530382 RepID=UPI00140ACB53|nr:hypothetical protein [Nonomuraea mesophila]